MRSIAKLFCAGCLALLPGASSAGTGLVTGDFDAAAHGLVTREAGELRFVVAEGPLPRVAGLRPIELGGDEELFLVALDHEGEREALLAAGRLIEAGDRFALIAADESASRELDRLGACRERILWIPSHPARGVRQIAGRADPAVKQAIVDAITDARYAQIVRELSGDLSFFVDGGLDSTDNRYTHTAGSGADIDIAAAYLQDRFEAAGYDVTRQTFPVGATNTDNIIAIKPGTTNAGEIIVVGAHYDSTSQTPGSLAPGAEDNASGTAAVLQLAEVFADYETERTIHFVCFSGEEQGLYGSQYYVSQLGSEGWNVIHALTMDMVSAWETNYKVIIEGQPAWEPLMSILESNVATWSQIGSRKDYVSFGSDHVPFQQAGISALLAIEWDWAAYDHYHRNTDTWQYLDGTLGRRISQGIAGALADLTNPAPVGTDAPARLPGLVLEQNSPNPFNPRTVIRFQTAQAGPVSLRVYDLAGRLVQTIVDQSLEAGRHIAQWNGTDAAGRAVSSGNYVLRLGAGAEVRSRRMTLVR